MLSALIFYTLLFIALVVAPAGLILVFLLFLDHEHQLWQRATPIIWPIGAMLARMPVIVGLGRRFPRTTAFLVHRFDSGDLWGLPATVAALGTFSGMWFFLGVLQDIVAKDPLVTLDVRLHNAVPLFRTTDMTWFMLVLTELGSSTVLSLLCLGIVLIALARNGQRLAATFVLALAATAILSTLLKALIGQVRPINAMISANAASFPSGHLLSGTVMYGLLAALLLSSRAGRSVRALGITLLLLVIIGIGLSRLYLGVHWPSDLLGSLALALILLPPLLFFLHYGGRIRWIDTFHTPLSARAAYIAGSSALVIAVGVPAVLANHARIVSMDPPPTRHSLDIFALRTSLPPDLPRQSEDLIGGKMEPISLVLVGSEKNLLDGFMHAGWARADHPTPVRVLQEGLAALRNLPDPTGPATPAFLADRPQDLTFEKSDTGRPRIVSRPIAVLYGSQLQVTTSAWDFPSDSTCLLTALTRLLIRSENSSLPI
jgi:membrane-associated phospholipid phosphatase